MDYAPGTCASPLTYAYVQSGNVHGGYLYYASRAVAYHGLHVVQDRDVAYTAQVGDYFVIFRGAGCKFVQHGYEESWVRIVVGMREQHSQVWHLGKGVQEFAELSLRAAGVQGGRVAA